MPNLKSLTKPFLIIGLLFVSLQGFAGALHVNTDKNDVAIKGYDPVAYFTEGKPVEGSTEFMAVHDGAIYQFSSKKHRELFNESPEKYAPQYGGFCAYGVTQQRKFKINPDAWEIVNGKLYLNLNKKVQKRWTKDKQEYIKEGDSLWAEIKPLTKKELKERF